MKKLVNLSFLYAMLGIAAGVFYREFTKFNGFEGRTTLGFVHTHLFVLGMVFFLLLTLLEARFALTKDKRFRLFFILYNAGLGVAAVMLVARGIPQVLGSTLSAGLSASISGISGLAHLSLTVGLVLFFQGLRRRVEAASVSRVS